MARQLVSRLLLVLALTSCVSFVGCAEEAPPPAPPVRDIPGTAPMEAGAVDTPAAPAKKAP